MRALFITACVVLAMAAAGIGVLAMSPAPERPDSMTLVIETGSVPRTTAAKTEDRKETTGALGRTAERADETRSKAGREPTLDEVIAARLREAERSAERDETGEPAAPKGSLESGETAETAVTEQTGLPGVAISAGAAQSSLADAEQPNTRSGGVSVTQMLAAELAEGDPVETPDAEDASRAADVPGVQVGSSEQQATDNNTSATVSGEAKPTPETAEQETVIAALDPRDGEQDASVPAELQAPDSATIGETPEQLIGEDPAQADSIAPDPERVPLAAGEAPPNPAQRGGFRVKGRIALIIRGLGVNADLTARAIEAMPAQVALGFVPYGEKLTDWTQHARSRRHDVLIQIPLEPEDYPDTNPGPHTLLTSLSIDENLERLDWLLDRFDGISGVTNYLGDKFAAAPGALAPVLMELKARKLIYLDDGKAANPTARQIARQISLDYGVADGMIDEASRSPEAIKEALEKVEAVARSEGKAIAIGHAHGATLNALQNWIAGLREKGLVLDTLARVLAAPPPRQVSQTSDG